MWFLVYRNHRIIQHLASWSSRAPFLSSLLAISHQIISFKDYFNFRKDLFSLRTAFIKEKILLEAFGKCEQNFIHKMGYLFPVLLRGHDQMNGTVSRNSGILLPRETRKSIESDTSTYHTPHKHSVPPKCQDRSTGGPVKSTKPFKVYCSNLIVN